MPAVAVMLVSVFTASMSSAAHSRAVFFSSAK